MGPPGAVGPRASDSSSTRRRSRPRPTRRRPRRVPDPEPGRRDGNRRPSAVVAVIGRVYCRCLRVDRLAGESLGRWRQEALSAEQRSAAAAGLEAPEHSDSAQLRLSAGCPLSAPAGSASARRAGAAAEDASGSAPWDATVGEAISAPDASGGASFSTSPSPSIDAVDGVLIDGHRGPRVRGRFFGREFGPRRSRGHLR